MSNDDQVQRRQDNAARQELRRLVSDRQPPGEAEASAFGRWAEFIAPLRAVYHTKGADGCRALFLEQVRDFPRLGVLLSGEPERVDTKHGRTWDDIDMATFPDPVWVVPGFLPAGLVTIGGRPKIGKSWLALQIACAVGTGGQVFGRPVSKGKVLYLALEDSFRRIQLRGRKQLWPRGTDVTFYTEWRTLGEGGTAALRERIEQDGFTLVIVDTLTRALGRADQMDMAETSVAIGELQRLAQELAVTVLLLDHHRKSNGLAPDAVDDLLGSTGKALPLDGVCGLYRQRGKKEAVLRVTGRDVQEAELNLAFDGLTCTWTPLQEPGGPDEDGPQGKVLALVRDLTAAGELAYASRIAEELGRDRSNVGRAITQLLRDGLIREGPPQGKIVPLYPAGEGEPDPAQQAQQAQHAQQAQQAQHAVRAPVPVADPPDAGQGPQQHEPGRRGDGAPGAGPGREEAGTTAVPLSRPRRNSRSRNKRTNHNKERHARRTGAADQT